MTDFANLVVAVPGDPTLLELYKAQNDVDKNDTSQDLVLSQYLEMAGAAAESYIDNIIEKRTVTEKWKNTRTPIALRYWPVVDNLSVVIDGEDKTDEYTLYLEDGIGWSVKGNSENSIGEPFIQVDVSYDAGYDPLPADLAFALIQSSGVYSQGSSGGPVSKESIVGVGSITYDTSDSSGSSVRVGMLPASAVAVLDKYRRMYA
jgi:hypothetical protein